jgi:hypothetical protein
MVNQPDSRSIQMQLIWSYSHVSALLRFQPYET